MLLERLSISSRQNYDICVQLMNLKYTYYMIALLQKNTWSSFYAPRNLCHTLNIDFDAWLMANLSSNLHWNEAICWNTLSLHICLFLCKWRKNIVVDANLPYHDSPRNIIVDSTIEWVNTSRCSSPNKVQVICTYPSWSKLGVDGCRLSSISVVGAGGFICDNTSN